MARPACGSSPRAVVGCRAGRGGVCSRGRPARQIGRVPLRRIRTGRPAPALVRAFNVLRQVSRGRWPGLADDAGTPGPGRSDHRRDLRRLGRLSPGCCWTARDPSASAGLRSATCIALGVGRTPTRRSSTTTSPGIGARPAHRRRPGMGRAAGHSSSGPRARWQAVLERWRTRGIQ